MTQSSNIPLSDLNSENLVCCKCCWKTLPQQFLTDSHKMAAFVTHAVLSTELSPPVITIIIKADFMNIWLEFGLFLL